MLLNIVLLLIGAAFLIYGITKKMKFWIAAGAVILCLGLASAGMDYFTAGSGNDTNDINNRTPFVVGSRMN